MFPSACIYERTSILPMSYYPTFLLPLKAMKLLLFANKTSCGANDCFDLIIDHARKTYTEEACLTADHI